MLLPDPISDQAIERSTPLLFGLYSLVTLFGQALYPDGCIPIAQSAWYHKQTATFRDVLAAIRRLLWGHETFPTSPPLDFVQFSLNNRRHKPVGQG
jgi:cyanate permease